LNHQLQEATELAELSARTDFLTGLNNRRHFCEMAAMQAEFCRRQRYPISLILLDVDDFKKINDSKGHHSGDLALQHLSTILRQSIRSSDICGRIGGEEFAVLLLKADLGDAETMAERIRSTIDNNAVETKGGGFEITVSVGVATGDFGVEVLLRMADKALYRAKEAGRNQVCQYSSSVDGLLGVI
jgi:diguanylate cyclase (GGDEF)-like protein